MILEVRPFLRLGLSSLARCSSNSACMAASVSCLIRGVRMPSLPLRSLPSRSALMAASMSKVGLVISHLFFANDKEMTQNYEHYLAEYFKGGSIPGIKLADAVLWSSIASILSSTVATYWAHKKKCKMAYKEQ